MPTGASCSTRSTPCPGSPSSRRSRGCSPRSAITYAQLIDILVAGRVVPRRAGVTGRGDETIAREHSADAGAAELARPRSACLAVGLFGIWQGPAGSGTAAVIALAMAFAAGTYRLVPSVALGAGLGVVGAAARGGLRRLPVQLATVLVAYGTARHGSRITLWLQRLVDPDRLGDRHALRRVARRGQAGRAGPRSPAGQRDQRGNCVPAGPGAVVGAVGAGAGAAAARAVRPGADRPRAGRDRGRPGPRKSPSSEPSRLGWPGTCTTSSATRSP